MDLSIMKNQAMIKIARAGLLLSKHSPAILVSVGCVGVVGSAVLACRATLKLEVVVSDAQEKFEKIHLATETLDETVYSETDARKDKALVVVQTGVALAKLYGPAVILGALSLSAIIGAHTVLNRRNVGLLAAYKAVDGGFKQYRSRVIEECGDEKDYEFRTGTKRVVNGDDERETPKFEVANKEASVSQYARWFDESSINWNKHPDYNLTFLLCQQNYANAQLRARGHVFLNEVYDLLDIPRSQAGALVGWVYDGRFDVHDDVSTEPMIDFGIFDNKANPRQFVNGIGNEVLLDFNVEGVIYDML